MAGTEVAPVDAKSTAVATYDYGADAGAGFENTTAADFKPSFLRLLQPTSPQVDEVPGAKAGLYIDSITNEVHEKPQFVAALREHVYVAWKPRQEGGGGGEGFGGVFQLTDPMVVEALGKLGDKFQRGDDGKLVLARTPDGEHQLIETVYFHGVQVLDPVVGAVVPASVPFASTGLGAAGNWFTTMGRLLIPGVGKQYPLYAHMFVLGSLKKEKGGNKWYVPTVQFANGTALESRLDPQGSIYQAAKGVAAALREGRAKVDYGQAGRQESAEGTKSKRESDIPF